MHAFRLYLKGTYRVFQGVGYGSLLLSLALIVLINLVCWNLWQPLFSYHFGSESSFYLAWVLCSLLYLMGTRLTGLVHLLWQGCLLGNFSHLVAQIGSPWLGSWAELLGLLVSLGLLWWFFLRGQDGGNGDLRVAIPVSPAPSPVSVR
ncbi:hypothetical protein [Candidatus Cyanaurora vandensis]|uniref:hypothetical protein n=1 Tax=Candidatus Cyanaurora vandensis TaxID=2714958 RepID=UPI00257A8428|nr:hypothetical protein [Candidatus Cyanaurora vandensis]